MLAAFSPGGDFKRYYRGQMPRLALLVIILMPLMYGALYLWAFWNPFAAADKMPVALVNLDRGASVEGKPLRAGEQVADGLIDSKQLDLHLVSEHEAEEGVAHGRYYFSITLPENFSSALASPLGDAPNSAQLIFTYNDANNYLATIIGQDAAQQVVNTVSSQVGAQAFEIALNEVGDLEPKLREAAAGVDQLNAGMQTANTGAHELATNLVTAQGGAAELAAGLDQLNLAVTTATNPILGALDEVGTSAAGAAELGAIVERLGVSTGIAAEYLNNAAITQSQAAQLMDRVVAQLRASPNPDIRGLADLLAPVQGFLTAEGLGPNADNQLTRIQTDVQIVSEQLSSPSGPLRSAISLFESGTLRTDIETARAAVGELSSVAGQLSSGLTQLSDGANELAGGTTQLTEGTEELSTKVDDGIAMLPTWDSSQRDQLAHALAEPVELKEDYTNKADTFGTGFAPFFFGLALFVGSIIAWMLFTPLQARPIAQGLNSLRVVMASFGPTLFVGFLQAAILYLVVVFAIGLRPVYPVATFLFMLLMVATFMAMIQMFNAVFGAAVGRVATLAFLMVMLTSAGGIYPVETTTKPFQYIHWVDPMTYTVNGLRQLTVGGIDYRLGVSVAVLSGLTAAFLAISTWAARRDRQYTMDRLYPPVEV